jgi:tetratricopeptide (TPR) repeat protein
MFRGHVGTIVIMVVGFIIVIWATQYFVTEITRDHFSSGNTHLANKEYDKAIAEYTQAIKLQPNDARPHERLAWVLATAAKDELRDGKNAVDHAKKACELTDWKKPDYLATLSAAFAESGDFQEAIKWLTKALEAPELPKFRDKEYRKRLKMFQEGIPYRE